MGGGRLSRGSGDRCQGAGAGLCAFLILLENRTKPRGQRMRSLTMAVPTEKAAVRQAMPRGRRRWGRGCGQRGRAAGKRRARPRLGGCAGRGIWLWLWLRLRPQLWPRPRPRPARAGPARDPRLAGAQGRGGAGRCACSCFAPVRRGCPSSRQSGSSRCPRPWPGWCRGSAPAPEAPSSETRGAWASDPGPPAVSQRGSPSRTATSKPAVPGQGGPGEASGGGGGWRGTFFLVGHHSAT